MDFKYKFVVDRNARGFLSKNGNVNEQGLNLDGELIPSQFIRNTSAADSRLLITVSNKNKLGPNTQKHIDNRNSIVLEVSKADVDLLEKVIDRQTSSIHAEQSRQALEAKGEGSRFKASMCPHCEATIELTNFKPGQYTYCKYCESFFDQSNTVVTNGDTEKICGSCTMFDTVDNYTVFYFYFLIVRIGFVTSKKHFCNQCAKSKAKKALLINLPFILGIVPAIRMWAKASSSDRKGMKGLAKANAQATKGKYEAADLIYNEILTQYHNHPAVLRNMALGHLNGGDDAGYHQILQQSLSSAPNYSPSVILTKPILNRQATNAKNN